MEFTIHPTRFAELAYINQTRGLWRFIATDALPQISVVGPQYRTRAELLADMSTYARDAWGLAGGR